MKKLLFATITFISISASAFANVNPVKEKEIKSEVKVNARMISAEIEDCRNRGGICKVIISHNGSTLTIRTCCDSIRIIPA